MDHFLAALIIIFLPGIIAVIICDKATFHSKWGSFKYSLYAFVLGISSYITLQLLYYLGNLIYNQWNNEVTWSQLETWEFLVSNQPKITPHEIFLATLVAIPIAYLATYLINHKTINIVAQKLNISNKYGDENLFSFYLEASDIDWVYIRDIDSNLTYEGRVQSYSETEAIQELVLYDVRVFRYEDSAELYSVPSLYLSKPLGKFIIEAVPINV